MTTSSSIGVALSPYGMSPIIPGAVYTQAQASVASTTTDIYTCPTGKRAFIYGYHVYAHTGAPSAFFKIKISGSYYRITPTTALTGPQGSGIVDYMTVIEAGQSMSGDSSSGTTFMRFSVMEFDATVPFYSPRITSLATGDNTLYTCPTGFSAKIMEMPGRTDKGTGYFANDSGGTRTYNFNQVISGGSVATTNRSGASNTLATAGLAAPNFVGLTLSAGGFINFNVDANTATQHVWLTVFETPV